MLGPSRLMIYKYAYNVRLERGEKLEDIDNSYLTLKRLTEDEVKQIHDALGL